MSETAVLDASALLCLLNGEAGCERVAERLPNSIISTVNLSEVIAKLGEYGMNAADIRTALSPLHLTAIDFDEPQAIAAGMLRRQTRAAGLSFGDRACLALAISSQATALTSDRAWDTVGASIGISVETLR